MIGIGSYAPEHRLTNSRLEEMVDTSDEWIVKRTGIRERRISMGETTWEMGLKAGQAALADAGLDAEALDLILVSTVTPDSYTPTVSCVLQDKLGASHAMPRAPGLCMPATWRIAISAREKRKTCWLCRSSA